MKDPLRILLIPLLLQLFLSGCAAVAANGEEEGWAPTPPRVSFIDGEVSYFRQGGDEWATARVNLPLAEGDALYTGSESNFEVQFGGRSFVRADENSQLTLVRLEEGYTQFEVTSGRVSFDMRRISAGSRVEVNTPNAVFLIQDPGYYRVEVDGRDTHFITRHGGEATVTTADGRSLGIYPSEDIVVTAGTPVQVATYAAPPPDDWDRWNDARSDRIGESVSARYLPPNVYGAEELDHYGYWRVVPTYGAVWIPYGVSTTWVPYSTGYWVWDPYYEWTWVDDAPWGWAPFHYGRWVYIDGYWAWAPGPVVPRAVYAPALVGFMVVGSGVSVSVSVGLPGVWWVPLGWGEPLVPWWHRHRYHGHPRWDGWGGPHIINGRDYRDRPLPKLSEIRYHNTALPHAILTVPPDKFGRERIHATAETRHSRSDFVPLRDEVPIKPSRDSLYGGAPRGLQPPREIISRPVVSTRPQPQPAPRPWQEPGPRTSPPPAQQEPRATRPEAPKPRFVVPPTQPRATGQRPLPRPPFGTEGGPEVTPQPLPPRYGDIKRSAPAAPLQREQQQMERREQTPRPLPPQPREMREEPREQMERRETSRPQQPQRRETREEQREQMSRPQPPQRMREEQRELQRPLPGRPANQPHKKFERAIDR